MFFGAEFPKEDKVDGSSAWRFRDKQGAHQDWKTEDRDQLNEKQLRSLHQSQHDDGEPPSLKACQRSPMKAVNHRRKNEILVLKGALNTYKANAVRGSHRPGVGAHSGCAPTACRNKVDQPQEYQNQMT